MLNARTDRAEVPAPRGAQMATTGRCLPSGLRGEPIAGDFFDVFFLDDSQVLIAVGDVVGHGLGAADRMTELRAETRTLAWRHRSPLEVLRRLDLLLCQRGPDEFATLWLGIYDLAADRLDHANAGHPPPIVAESDGQTRLLREASAPPLGTGFVADHAVLDSTRLDPGTLLVAYSDGLVERSDRDLEEQLELLRSVVEATYQSNLTQAGLEVLVDEILRRVPPSLAHTPDDVCILAVCPTARSSSRTQVIDVNANGQADIVG